jgi:hypothetical protein
MEISPWGGVFAPQSAGTRRVSRSGGDIRATAYLQPLRQPRSMAKLPVVVVVCAGAIPAEPFSPSERLTKTPLASEINLESHGGSHGKQCVTRVCGVRHDLGGASPCSPVPRPLLTEGVKKSAIPVILRVCDFFQFGRKVALKTKELSALKWPKIEKSHRL